MSKELTMESLADRGEQILSHFGVPGMKWGVRKSKKSGGSSLSVADKVELGANVAESASFMKMVANSNGDGPFGHHSLAGAGLIESTAFLVDVAILSRASKKRNSTAKS